MATFTYDRTTSNVSLYVNGSLKKTSIDYASGTIGAEFSMGVRYFYNDYDFDGLVDELSMWVGKCLSPDEVAELWNDGDGFPYPFTPPDTCTYSSGNWDVTCSDNCSITSDVDLGGNNLTLSNNLGTFNVEANITNFDKLFKYDLCQINVYSTGGLRAY
jgi:hypothetical protein